MPNIVDEYYKINKFSFAFDFIGVNKSFKKEEIQFNYLKRSHNNKVFFPWKMFFKIKKLNPDVVYIQSLAYPHYILVLQLFLKFSCKIIVQDHADSYPSGLKNQKNINRLILLVFYKIVFACTFV